MQVDNRRPNHSLPLHLLASLRRERLKKSPAKSTRSQSFLFRPQKHHQKKVRTVANRQLLETLVGVYVAAQ